MISLLPEEILGEILIRIPAESLIGLKVVCKRWYSLISDRDFGYSHLSHWKSRPGIISHVIMPNRSTKRHHFLSFEFSNRDVKANCFNLSLEDCFFATKKSNHGEEISVFASCDCRRTNFKLANMHNYLRVLASCNGLLLVLYSGYPHLWLFVCNPITRICTLLPHLPPDFGLFCWTLVFDASIRKYKIIGTMIDYPDGISRRQRLPDICYAFTLGCSNSWRELHTSFRHEWISHLSVSANGKLHWLASYDHGKETTDNANPAGYKGACMYSMDIATEEFEETPCPLPRFKPWHNFLEMNGNLYFTEPKSPSQVHIWVLKDWDTMAWSNYHMINLDSTIFLYRPENFTGLYNYSLPITILDSLRSGGGTKLIIQHNETLLTYEVQCREVRKVDINCEGTLLFFNYPELHAVPAYTKFLHLNHVNGLVNWH